MTKKDSISLKLSEHNAIIGVLYQGEPTSIPIFHHSLNFRVVFPTYLAPRLIPIYPNSSFCQFHVQYILAFAIIDFVRYININLFR